MTIESLKKIIEPDTQVIIYEERPITSPDLTHENFLLFQGDFCEIPIKHSRRQIFKLGIEVHLRKRRALSKEFLKIVLLEDEYGT